MGRFRYASSARKYNNIISINNLTYVVVKPLSQAITCTSSLNVSGYTTLINNVTCMNNLNINENLYSNTTSTLTDNLNLLSKYSNLNINHLST